MPSKSISLYSLFRLCPPPPISRTDRTRNTSPDNRTLSAILLL